MPRPARTPARIPFHNERARALWTQEHQRHLMTWSRPALYAAWDEACLGMKTEGRRARKHDLAGDLSRSDAQMLAEDWFDDPGFQDDIKRAEERVRQVGTPTRWAEDPEPTADDPCPFNPSPDRYHGCRSSDPVCTLCGADLSSWFDEEEEARRRAKYALAAEHMREARAARSVTAPA